MKKTAVLVAFLLALTVLFAGCAKSGDDTITTTEAADPMATYVYDDYVTVYAIDGDSVVAGQYRWSDATLDKILGTYASYANGVLTIDGKAADTTKGETWNVYINGEKTADNNITSIKVAGGDLIQFKLEGGTAATTAAGATTAAATTEPTS